MILSNMGIQRALDDGALVIEPEPSPRRPSPDAECPYQTSAVDLQLGDEIAWLKRDLPINIDLREGRFTRLFTAGNAETLNLQDVGPFSLEPNRFVLGKTLERIHLPIRDKEPWLAARVEGRSSYARSGLLVHFTAPTIHAGYDGTITLEIMNLGPYRISLHPHTPICQLIIEMLDSKPFPNESQFHGQTSPAGDT